MEKSILHIPLERETVQWFEGRGFDITLLIQGLLRAFIEAHRAR
jgi:hypothetical protein